MNTLLIDSRLVGCRLGVGAREGEGGREREGVRIEPSNASVSCMLLIAVGRGISLRRAHGSGAM